VTLQCPRCGATKSWLLKDGRRRCARCRRDWRPGRLPLRLSRPQWREVLRWFVRDATSADIARETGLERKRVLRALTIVRQALLRDAQDGVHKPAAPRAAHAALIGLRVSSGRASAEVVPQAEAEHLGRWLRNRENGRAYVTRHSRRYMAAVYRGRLYRLAESGAERVPFGPIEAFWAYVQRQLRAKGGIRRERLDLYLASFAWRYNHRKVPPAEQVQELLGLVSSSRAVSQTGLSRWRKKA
jgi:transposase